MKRFEYKGKGGESVFIPKRIKLTEKGQIVEVADENYIKELENRPDKFKPVKTEKTENTKKGKTESEA